MTLLRFKLANAGHREDHRIVAAETATVELRRLETRLPCIQVVAMPQSTICISVFAVVRDGRRSDTWKIARIVDRGGG
ncbi:MAG: hypothetical protein BGO05_04120 [Rhizobiales bacterium 63-7]|nr:MAG: hypothetical protein BGO05_04120 [Rhizobiales bacterium 63-7]